MTSLFDLLDLGRNENYFDCGAGIVVKKTWARELKEHGVRIRPHNTEILPFYAKIRFSMRSMIFVSSERAYATSYY